MLPLCTLALTLLGGSVAAVDGVQVSAYELDVRLDPQQGRLSGKALVFIDPGQIRSEHLTFYLHGELRVDEVSVGGKSVGFSSEPVSYSHDYSLVARAVRIPLAGLDIGEGLSVAYSGFFHASRARSPSDYMRIDADGVHLRSFGYSLWFPVFLGAGQDSHEVSFLRVRLDTPEEFVPVFVGTQLESRTEGGRRISEWEAECNLFEAQCTARRFTVTENDGMFVYALKDSASQAVVQSILSFAGQFRALSQEYYGGRSGEEQVHVVQMTKFGDVASGNVVGISDATWRSFATQEWPRETLAHELIHDSVVIPVRRRDPLYALVVEGFPSYFHLPLLDEMFGGGFLARFMQETERSYLGRRAGGVGLPELPLTEIGPEQVGLYKDRFVLNDRALLFCDYLRRRMGPETHRDFVRRLFARKQLDRKSFEALVEEHLPGARGDLATWLDTTEFPEKLHLPK